MATYPNLDPPPPDPLEGLRRAIARMDEAVTLGAAWIAPLEPKTRLKAAMAEVRAALEAAG